MMSMILVWDKPGTCQLEWSHFYPEHYTNKLILSLTQIVSMCLSCCTQDKLVCARLNKLYSTNFWSVCLFLWSANTGQLFLVVWSWVFPKEILVRIILNVKWNWEKNIFKNIVFLNFSEIWFAFIFIFTSVSQFYNSFYLCLSDFIFISSLLIIFGKI